MVQKALAILLILSWIVFSGVDMFEDLDFESHSGPSVSSSPHTAKPVKLANDNVELANHTFIYLKKFSRRMDLESTAHTTLVDESLDSRALRSHKDNCVFLI
jgi:hypothetical protein